MTLPLVLVVNELTDPKIHRMDVGCADLHNREGFNLKKRDLIPEYNLMIKPAIAI